MSNAVVASVDNSSVVYWNPSALMNITSDITLDYMHSEYFAGIAKYDYLSGAFRIDQNSAAGIALIRFGIDNIPNTLHLYDENGNVRYDRISTFTAADYALLLSYARNDVFPGFQIGGNVKIIRRNTGKFANAWGFGLDASASYQLNEWKFAGVLRDVTTTFNAWNFNEDELSDVFEMTGNKLPENALELTLPSLILGGARYFALGSDYGITPELNLNMTFDKKHHTLIKSDFANIDPYLGVEGNYKKIAFVRLGIGSIQKIEDFDQKTITAQPGFGIGLNLTSFSVDYAMSNIASAGSVFYSHVFSISYKIGTAKK
jgi:hypothetical protein